MPYPPQKAFARLDLTGIKAIADALSDSACNLFERRRVMRLRIGIILAAALANAAPALDARQHEHAAAPVASQQQPATPRFASDATLRREMQGIRTAVDALEHYEHGHMSPVQAMTLASEIDDHVRTIIANCKLPPDADAALHGIIVPLMENAGALKQRPEDLSAIAPMRSALNRYDSQFQDP